ncbi:MAG: hypothetical protein ISS15_07495 [Alphaproteobacteria bacterium]|nr:hypothetical protein [Alphaproteobacteria bacterium]MBL7097484.1 hypothetical protein [Alphaproteobacteria bacterium]
MSFSRLHFGAMAVLAALITYDTAHAHGVVGDRFFPATIATDDPFAADELALPTVTFGQGQEEYDFEWSKSIVKGFSISINGGYVDAHGPSGWNNFEVTPTWQFLTDNDSEFLASAAMSFEIGGSGSHAVADTFTTYRPKILFGKGFGQLPDSMALLRPLAVTGVVGYAIPGSSTASKRLEWGGAVEYSLLYLQTNVRDQGFPNFVAHLTPVVEFSFQTPTDTGGGGTTGTINPGLIWSGQYAQFTAEAVIPANSASGNNVGGMVQLHFYLDDIFPNSLGAPIFGGKR